MSTAGIELSSEVIQAFKDTATGIGATIVKIAPTLMVSGLGIYGILTVINRIPGFFRRFIG